MENKNTFFRIDLTLPTEYVNSLPHMKELEDNLDMVLYAMQVSNDDIHKISRVDGRKLIILFKANTRKRKGQLAKFCERHLGPNIQCNAKGISKDDLTEALIKAENSPQFTVVSSSNSIASYDGKDIEIFKDKKNWHPWQKSVYNMIYCPADVFTEPDQRSIISLIDYKGASGKSTFFKYLYVQDKLNGSNQIGRITYGSAQQLRSALIGLGQKKLYIVDLSRSKSRNDNQEDLLSVLEDCKTGFLISPMYGNPRELIMPPPHIIVSSNYLFDPEALSKDRWAVYEIRDNKLGPKNYLLKRAQSKQKSKTIKK